MNHIPVQPLDAKFPKWLWEAHIVRIIRRPKCSGFWASRPRLAAQAFMDVRSTTAKIAGATAFALMGGANLSAGRVRVWLLKKWVKTPILMVVFPCFMCSWCVSTAFVNFNTHIYIILYNYIFVRSKLRFPVDFLFNQSIEIQEIVRTALILEAKSLVTWQQAFRSW